MRMRMVLTWVLWLWVSWERRSGAGLDTFCIVRSSDFFIRGREREYGIADASGFGMVGGFIGYCLLFCRYRTSKDGFEWLNG